MAKAHPGFKACARCHEELPLAAFWKRRTRGVLAVQPYCKACNNQNVKEFVARRSVETKMLLDEYKMARGCVDCGYSAHAEALDFDHLSDKRRGISYMKAYSRETLWEEVAKCDVVCANCHRVRTASRRKEQMSVC